jgi:aminoglycoside phosphotransferase (APT) family kinase protein
VVAWPFTNAELTAGLRRYFAQPALHVRTLAAGDNAHARRAREARGLTVTYEVDGDAATIECVVKEPRAARRPGLAHPGVREAGLYRALAVQLPMATPALIAADSAGSWLVVEAVDAEPEPVTWGAQAFEQAVTTLAALHERFWGLSEDLSAYPWLARPLTLDYEIHVYAAAQALGRIVRYEQPAVIAQSAPVLSTLGQIISQADQVVQPLRALPFTLLHGDFSQRNLVRDEDGDPIVLDWQRAAIGPGLLDLLVLVTNSCWDHGELPVPESALTTHYRAELKRCLHVAWTDAEWELLWDHARLWRFMQETLSWAASTPPSGFDARAGQFEELWLQPVLAAAERRLEKVGGSW